VLGDILGHWDSTIVVTVKLLQLSLAHSN